MRLSHLPVVALVAASSTSAIPIESRSLFGGFSGLASSIGSLLSGSGASSWSVPGVSSSSLTNQLQNAVQQIASLQGSSATSLASLLHNLGAWNGASSRQSWGSGFNILNDFDQSWPTTGRVVSYSLTVSNMTLSPDGFPREVLAVNGQYPGPTIYANWGDTLRITVHNQMPSNGTSFHWHGLRQYQSNPMDGVPGVTECPIAPGQSKTYTFQCTQFGTSWYHSHFSDQYGDGVVGPIVINGPATMNYDVDLGPMPMTDWYHTPVQALGALTEHTFAAPPTPDNALINGTMTSSYGGHYSKTTITRGKKYRIRLINTSVNNNFVVSLDNHPFTVIAADFVPIVPFTTNSVFIAIGQRYDVIITANQPVANYWFRADPQAACGPNANAGNIKSIFSYQGASNSNPTSQATNYVPRCTDETNLVPFWNTYVNPSPLTSSNSAPLDVTNVNYVDTNGQAVVQWNVNASSLKVDWSMPLLSYAYTGNTSYPSRANLISLPSENQWYFWIVQQVQGTAVFSVPHPIHLHGHDFFVLGTGEGTFSVAENSAGLNYNNPTRRDTAMLPANGWLVLAFETDNPGAWLMHCHIAWHASEGLAVNFLESASTIPSFVPETWQYQQQCASWKSYYPQHSVYLQDDSGI